MSMKTDSILFVVTDGVEIELFYRRENAIQWLNAKEYVNFKGINDCGQEIWENYGEYEGVLMTRGVR